MFEHIDPFPGDPILSLNEAFQKDPRAHKINLSIGIYFDEEGRIPVLDCVRRAEAEMVEQGGAKPYLNIEGDAACRAAVQTLLFGANSPALAASRVATLQTVGSSGALKVGADFLHRWLPDSAVYVSDPTWDNHRSMFEGAGVKVHTYPYYDPATGGVRFDAMREVIAKLPPRSIVLLHACCHNPTGVDLTRAQWDALAPLLKERELLPFLDIAYQGYGDGLQEDAYAIRCLADAGASFFVANSFSKNMSVYGERAGALSLVCQTAAEAALALGQLKATVRRNYSSPAIHAGGIVARVLTQPALRSAWERDVAAMRERILAMRKRLHEALGARLPDRDFDYLLTQRGMFSFTGLTAQQVDRLRDEHAVYMIRSGRICISGLTTRNVEPTADAIAAVIDRLV
jgi:aromatic-amino-acid transaminase